MSCNDFPILQTVILLLKKSLGSLRQKYHTRALVQIAFLSFYRMFFANSTKLFVNIFTSGLCSITSSTRNRAIAIFPTIPFTIHYKCNWLIYKGVEQSQMHMIKNSLYLADCKISSYFEYQDNAEHYTPLLHHALPHMSLRTFLPQF